MGSLPNPLTSLLQALINFLSSLMGGGTSGGRGAAPLPPSTFPRDPEPAPSRFGAFFDKHGARWGIDPRLLEAIARAESSLNPSAVNVNRDGSRDLGLMQINTNTALRLGVSQEALFDPETSISTAARLLDSIREELRRGLNREPSQDEIISAYNVGGPTVRRRGIINPEYVRRVNGFLA